MSSQPKTVTQTTTKELPEAFRDLPDQYVALLGDTSVATAPLNQGQQQALSSLSAAGASGQAQLDEALGLLRNTATGGYVGANPYLDSQVAKAQGDVTDKYMKAVAPSIDANAARAGIFGGSVWQGQQADARDALAEGLSDVASQMRGQAYTTERNQQEAAVRDMLNASDAGVKMQQSLFGAYEPARLAEQAVMDEGQRRLALLNQALGLGYSGASTSSSQPNPSYVSPFQQLAGLGLMGAGLVTGNPVAAKAGSSLL